MTKLHKYCISLIYIFIFWGLYRYVVAVLGRDFQVIWLQLSFYIPTFLIIKLWSGSFRTETKSFFGILLKCVVSYLLIVLLNYEEYWEENKAYLYFMLLWAFWFRIVCMVIMVHLWCPSILGNKQKVFLFYTLAFISTDVFLNRQKFMEIPAAEYIAEQEKSLTKTR